MLKSSVGPSLSIEKDFFPEKIAKMQAVMLIQAIYDLFYGWGGIFYNARAWIFGEMGREFMRDPFSFIRICHDTDRDPEAIRAKIFSRLSIAKRRKVTDYWQSVIKNNSNRMASSG